MRSSLGEVEFDTSVSALSSYRFVELAAPVQHNVD
jgi:hypothetical protein